MNRSDNCYDNAVAENFFASFLGAYNKSKFERLDLHFNFAKSVLKNISSPMHGSTYASSSMLQI